MEASGRFCRRCGHRLPEKEGQAIRDARWGMQASSVGGSKGTDNGSKSQVGRCRVCGEELNSDRKFCPACGAAKVTSLADDVVGGANARAWHVIVEGLSRVWWGTLVLVVALVFAAASGTLLTLFASEPSGGGLRSALWGASAVGLALGLCLLLWGDLMDLRLPSGVKGRWQALAVFLLGMGAAVTGLVALAQSIPSGFDPDTLPRSAQVFGALALVFLVGRQVAFAALLRRLAFALRNYRIAQGSVGFIIYVGLGLALVGLLGLL
ncbi:MAG: zinc ribbon domain-containing protein, partial [Polyangia bacterium]|nr:zinc ribbon domain-containing protein [Polyangia bacterium]